MSKEIVGENITSLPTPDQDVRRLTAEGLIELTGTYHYTFEKAISVIREFSPSFHSGDSQQWSLVDLRALAIYLAYYRGARKPSLILILPKEFSPETFEEIDRTFLSYLQMAERWQVSSNYTIELTQLVFPLKLIAEQVPRKRIKNNCRSSLAFPPQFCLLMENELGKARKNHVPLIRWIKAHQKEIQERAKSYLPVFPHQFRQWLEENIIEKQESPESRWEPNKDEIKESIIKTAETITKIKARSPDGNELNDDNLHQTNLPAVSNVRLTDRKSVV